jgi:hypothetical protein
VQFRSLGEICSTLVVSFVVATMSKNVICQCHAFTYCCCKWSAYLVFSTLLDMRRASVFHPAFTLFFKPISPQFLPWRPSFQWGSSLLCHCTM